MSADAGQAYTSVLEQPLSSNRAALQQRESWQEVIWTTGHAAGASVCIVRIAVVGATRSERPL
jgi:hypothetical protein